MSSLKEYNKIGFLEIASRLKHKFGENIINESSSYSEYLDENFMQFSHKEATNAERLCVLHLASLCIIEMDWEIDEEVIDIFEKIHFPASATHLFPETLADTLRIRADILNHQFKAVETSFAFYKASPPHLDPSSLRLSLSKSIALIREFANNENYPEVLKEEAPEGESFIKNLILTDPERAIFCRTLLIQKLENNIHLPKILASNGLLLLEELSLLSSGKSLKLTDLSSEFKAIQNKLNCSNLTSLISEYLSRISIDHHSETYTTDGAGAGAASSIEP